MYFSHCFSQYNEFAKALAKGDLSVSAPPPENELAAPLKSLHASLKHLAWQSIQVAKGDYKQRVDFMGEFSNGFNTMVEQLADRQQKLENEIAVSQERARALEQGNVLLSNLTHYIPHQIFVVDLDTREIVLSNETAIKEIGIDPDYTDKLVDALPEDKTLVDGRTIDLRIGRDDFERFLAINAYLIQYGSRNAVALVVEDVSEEKKQIQDLEDKAYRDAMTRSYNRFFGMLTLNDWLEKKRRFVLVFVDMDSLKFVNDVHGHNEGDIYIIKVSKHLQVFSEDAIVCRLGGDEFMVLALDMEYDEAASRIGNISMSIENDEYTVGKGFSYSVSIGIVAVDEHNDLPASSILSTADERMYEHKRARKKERAAGVK
jgi:diguanylate cyclase (GGDEF)-like protein